MIRIESRGNSIIKNVASLKDGASRKEQGCFFFEGAHLLEEFIRSGGKARAVFLRDGAPEAYSVLAARAGGDIYSVPAQVYEKLTVERAPQGVLTVAETGFKAAGLASLQSGACLILENLQDPGNVGTVMRTAAAFGADVVLAGCADVFSPKAVRATMGALFFCDFAVCRSAGEAVSFFKKQNRRVIAAALYGKTKALGGFALEKGDCFVIGSEGSGVTRETLELCDFSVRIPMTGKTESLNAAAASAVLMWEAKRNGII